MLQRVCTQMILEQLKLGTMANLCYVLGDEPSRKAAVVDPHGEIDRIMSVIQAHGLEVEFIVNTHTHWDHVAGNEELKRRTGAAVLTHPMGRVDRDRTVEDGDRLSLGETTIQVLYTPGHSPDGICLLVDGKLLTGDTLFIGECGRTDLPGGDPGEMYHSLFGVILELDEEIEVFPGHDYGDRPHATLGHEKRHNYTLEPRTKEEFIQFMAEP